MNRRGIRSRRFGSASGIGPIPPNAVTSATLRAWYRTDLSVLGSTAPKAAGTTPPNITFDSTGSGKPDQIHISMGTPNSGAPGTAKVNVDLNGTRVLTNQSTTAATVAIPGSTISIIFPAAGTYAANNTWDRVAAGLLDLSGLANDCAAANTTTTTRGIVTNDGTGQNGQPFVLTDGVDDRLACTTTMPSTVGGGTDVAAEVWWFGKINAIDASPRDIWSFTRQAADANAPRMEVQVVSTSWRTRRHATGANEKVINSLIVPFVGNHLVRMKFDGTNITLEDNRVAIIGGDSGVSGLSTLGAALTIDTFSICEQFANTAHGGQLGANFYECVVFGGALSDSDAAGMYAYFD